MSAAVAAVENASTRYTTNDKIKCMIDGALTHSVLNHIKNNHSSEWTIERYKEEFPDEPILSPFAIQIMRDKKEAAVQEEKAAIVKSESSVGTKQIALKSGIMLGGELTEVTRPMHEVFGLPDDPSVRSARGQTIPVKTFTGHDDIHSLYLPEVDKDYVFQIDLVKRALMGIVLNMPVYLWGYHGTGKTSLVQQVAARTGRSVMRVQHTLNMQESDVIGQWTVKDGATVFELGPLPLAMMNGWIYIADEYDFAMPAVTSLYQPVLEGEALLIKDAPAELRKIVPHENFRFFATGNTNGVGDETGLYQGTNIQNAANYSRFGITEEVKYMEKAVEQSVLRAKARVDEKNAEKIIRFATSIREDFAKGTMSSTISPREIINAGKLGMALGGDYREGLKMAFINRLSRVDQKAANEFTQRIFG